MKTIILFIVATLAIFILSGCDDNKPQDTASRAYYAAYKFCERYAPSGQNFTTEAGGDVLDGRAEWLPDQTNWLSTGYVDAQNQAGALRHMRWAAHVTEDGANWKLIYLAVGDETLVGGD